MKLFRFNGGFRINIQQVDLKAIFVRVKEASETLPMDEETSNNHPWIRFLLVKQKQVQRYLSKSKFR